MRGVAGEVPYSPSILRVAGHGVVDSSAMSGRATSWVGGMVSVDSLLCVSVSFGIPGPVA